MEGRIIGRPTTQTWCCTRCRCSWLRVSEATARSLVGWRRLAVHLTVHAGRRTKALRSAVHLRSILCKSSLIGTRDLVALDFNGLLRFDQVLIQLLECKILRLNLIVQVTDVLK